MRLAAPILGLALVVAIGGCHRPRAAIQLESVTIPGAGAAQLAPGLWVESISDRRGVAQMRYCLDPTAAGRLAYLGGQLNDRCSRHDMARAVDGSWHFVTECDMGRWGRIATEGVIRGDFRSHYTVDARIATSGATATPNGETRIAADLRRVGDCPAGMKPGDIVASSGARATVEGLRAPA